MGPYGLASLGFLTKLWNDPLKIASFARASPLSACIPNEIATPAFYAFVAVAASINLFFAARILGNARSRSQDSTHFRGSLFLALVGVHRVQRRRWTGPTPSPQDQALLRHTRLKLLGLSFVTGIVGVALLFLLSSQTCWFQSLRSV
ncbi:hypothetical protein AB4Z40_24560 [Bosea sp. 2YAB26]|uniref:hypothetical protein n=1 Tax=Bosea sp. 2YAB26 TaxID=3237478 RepID=UPI003F91A1F5